MEQTCTIKYIIKQIKILDFYSKIYLFSLFPLDCADRVIQRLIDSGRQIGTDLQFFLIAEERIEAAVAALLCDLGRYLKMFQLLLDVPRYLDIAGMMTVGDKSAVMSVLIHFFFNSCHPSGT